MDEIINILYKLDDLCSIYKNDSDINKINKNGHLNYIQVDNIVIDIIFKSKIYHNITKGYMDITCKPLLDLVKTNKKDDINKYLYLVNSNNILIKEPNLIKLKYEGMSIDLGSIVKGYATDIIVDILNKYNIHDALIDLGGNIYVKGKNKNNLKWKVGIQDPFNIHNKPIGYLELSNKSVVTSGAYERGKHIINPHTGDLVDSDIKSVSIIADKSIDAEGLSTAYFIIGKQGIKDINKMANIDCIYIDENKNIYLSKGLKNKVIILNNDYKIKEI